MTVLGAPLDLDFVAAAAQDVARLAGSLAPAPISQPNSQTYAARDRSIRSVDANTGAGGGAHLISCAAGILVALRAFEGAWKACRSCGWCSLCPTFKGRLRSTAMRLA